MSKADITLRVLTDETVGSNAIDRPTSVSIASWPTLVDGVAASISGIITQIEIWVQTTVTNCRVGSIYDTSGEIFSSRDFAELGTVTAGSKQTFTQDKNGKPLAIRIEAGDYIGISSTTPDGAIEATDGGGSGIWVLIVGLPFSNANSAALVGYTFSIQATISSRYGFKLAHDRAGNLAWSVQQAPVLRPGQSMGAVSYADVPPEQELVWDSQRSAHGGFGQRDLSVGRDPTRYFTAKNADARFPGKVFCGPLLIEADLAPALGGSGLDGPVYCGCEHEKSYLIGAGKAIYQNLKPWSIKGTDISFSQVDGYISKTGGGLDSEALEAGRSFTISGSASNDGLYTVGNYSGSGLKTWWRVRSNISFAQVGGADDDNDTITVAIAAFDPAVLIAGKKIFIVADDYDPANRGIKTVVSCTTTVITVEENLVTEAAGNAVQIHEYLTDEAAGADITINSEFWRLVLDTAAGININSLVSSNGYVYAALKKTGGSAYQLSLTGNDGDWAAGAGGTVDYDFFCPLNSNLWGLRGLRLANVAAVSPADQGTDFDTSYKVGDASHDFTWVINHRGILVIGKKDGLYSIDQYGNDEHLIPELRQVSHELNFRRMISWQGLVFMPMGAGGLWVWPGTPYGDLSPRRFAPHDENYHGSIGGLAWDNNWIWGTAQGAVNGSYYNVGLLAGAFIQDERGSRWVWHPLTLWTDDEAHFLILFRAPTTNQPKLWLFRGVSAASGNTENYQPSYVNLPRYTDNPLEAGDDQGTAYAYYFASGGSITFSTWDGNLRAMLKAFFSLTIKGSNLCNVDAGGNAEEQRYIEVDYKIDDGSWVLAATSGFTLEADAADDGVTEEADFYFPANTTGMMITLRFKLYTTKNVSGSAVDPDETPVLELPFILRCRPRPTSAKQVAFSVQCEDGVAGGLSAAQIRTAWDDAFNAAWPITIIGPGGTEYCGTIQSPTPTERAVVRKHPTGPVSSIIDIALLQAELE